MSAAPTLSLSGGRHSVAAGESPMRLAERWGLGLAVPIACSAAGAALLVEVGVTAAVAFSLAIVTVGLLVTLRETPMHKLLVGGLLGLSATVDLIGHFRVGPTTAYAWVTGAVAAVVVVVALATPARSLSPAARRVIRSMALFPAWALLSILWAPVSLQAAQNLLVYLAFSAIVAVAAVASATGVVTFATLRRAMMWTLGLGSGLYCVSLALDGLGGSALVSARAYALFAAVGVGWCAALGRHGYRAELRAALVLSCLVLLSLSRTAFVASLLLLAVGLIGFRTPRDIRRSIAILVCIGAVAFGLYTYSNPFSARFRQGDVAAVGGFELNVMGREELWHITWVDALRHPLIGGGIGSADVLVRRATPSDDNPHNDYLRVFHDLGGVGLAALLLALGAPLVACYRAYRSTPAARREPRSIHLGGVLTLAALAFGMTTDNPLVYLFVLAPVAVVVGCSLGFRDDAQDRHYRSM